MADIVLQQDVGDLGALLRLSAAASATAGGAGDAATTTGATIDRFAVANGSPPLSLNAAVVFDAVLETGKTLTIGWDCQDSPDGTNFSDYATGSSVVATGSTGASAISGQLQVGVNLKSARRYVRFNSNPDLSATGTDTCVTRAVGFFAGFDRLPA